MRAMRAEVLISCLPVHVTTSLNSRTKPRKIIQPLSASSLNLAEAFEDLPWLIGQYLNSRLRMNPPAHVKDVNPNTQPQSGPSPRLRANQMCVYLGVWLCMRSNFEARGTRRIDIVKVGSHGCLTVCRISTAQLSKCRLSADSFAFFFSSPLFLPCT